MIFDRQRQRLLLQGKEYTAGDIFRLVAERVNPVSRRPAIKNGFIFIIFRIIRSQVLLIQSF